MIVVSEIYKLVDENMKRDENILSVDFYFNGEVTVDEATNMVDKMVAMLDDSTDAVAKEFIAHKPTIFTSSPFREENDG